MLGYSFGFISKVHKSLYIWIVFNMMFSYVMAAVLILMTMSSTISAGTNPLRQRLCQRSVAVKMDFAAKTFKEKLRASRLIRGELRARDAISRQFTSILTPVNKSLVFFVESMIVTGFLARYFFFLFTELAGLVTPMRVRDMVRRFFAERGRRPVVRVLYLELLVAGREDVLRALQEREGDQISDDVTSTNGEASPINSDNRSNIFSLRIHVNRNFVFMIHLWTFVDGWKLLSRCKSNNSTYFIFLIDRNYIYSSQA